MIKKIVIFLLISITLVFIYKKFFYLNIKQSSDDKNIEENIYTSNVIKDINYTTKDLNGNTYIITAAEGEIDLNNKDIIFLKKVDGLIKSKNSDDLIFKSKFGKYNTSNLNTILSKDVIITYKDNKITGDNLDYSVNRGTLIISRDVNYNHKNNILKADTVEVDVNSKNTKIYMYDTKKKINIKNF